MSMLCYLCMDQEGNVTEELTGALLEICMDPL